MTKLAARKRSLTKSVEQQEKFEQEFEALEVKAQSEIKEIELN